MNFGASASFGSKPVVPVWNPVLLGTSQQTSIGSNKAALPGAESLTSSANAFSQEQIQKMLASAIPGYSSIVSSMTGNIKSMVEGKLPSDVSGAIQDSAAARSLTGGFGGSGLAGNMTARDIGLTSLQLTEQGTSMAENWMSLADKMFSPGMIDVGSMFISPEQQFQADVLNAENTWNTGWLSSQIQAMPDPTSVGEQKAFASLLGGGSAIGGSSGGSGGSGGGSGGGSMSGIMSLLKFI